MVKIIRKILSPSLSNVPNRSMTPKYITVHNTANPSRGAGAELHSRYQHNGSGGRKVSWGYSVDDKVIYQTLEDNQQGFHAGTSKGNAESIGIEICENVDSDFEKAVSNAQGLIKQLMKKHNIPINRVVTHKYWSGKNCPRLLLGRWDSFIEGIEGSSNVSVSKPNKKPVSKPKQPTQSSYRSVSGNWTGQTLVQGVKGNPVKQLQTKLANNNPPFYPNKGAKNNGIDSYYGSDTANSVKRFQSYYGLTVDSKAGKEVYAKLGGKTSKPAKKKPRRSKLPSGILRQGSRGNDVKTLQNALNKANFKVGKADGIYGPKVKDGVTRLQKVHDPHNVDGIYGPRAKSRLQKLI